MIAEVTGQPLASITSGDVARWSAAWEDEPPIIIQQRNLLAQLLSIQVKDSKPQDFIPTRAKIDSVPDTPAVAYFAKYTTEISTDGIQH